MREDLIIDDTCELADELFISVADSEYTKCSALIAKFDVVSEVVKDLMNFEDTELYSMEMHPEEKYGYEKEYLLVLDNVLGVSVTPMYCDECGEYHVPYMQEFAIVLVDNDAPIRTVRGIDEDILQAFEF